MLFGLNGLPFEGYFVSFLNAMSRICNGFFIDGYVSAFDIVVGLSTRAKAGMRNEFIESYGKIGGVFHSNFFLKKRKRRRTRSSPFSPFLLLIYLKQLYLFC